MNTNNPRRLCFANIEEMERYYAEKARIKEEKALGREPHGDEDGAGIDEYAHKSKDRGGML